MSGTDQINVLNDNFTHLGRDIALLEKGFVVRELGAQLFKMPIDLPAGVDQEALATVNAAFFPRFRQFVLSLIGKLTVSADLRSVTSQDYVKNVNEVIKALHVARRFYCGQTGASDAKIRFNANVKKELLGVFADYVAAAYEKVLRQLGGGDRVRLVKQQINAATVLKGIELYNWNSPTIPVNLRLFGLTGNVGQPVTIGNVAPVNPGPPQRKEDFELNGSNGDGFGFTPNQNFNDVPEGAQSLTPPKTDTLETIKQKANESTTLKNKNLWLWVGGALVAGYMIKGRN